MTRRLISLIVLLVAALTLSACSGSGVRAQPPFVQVTSWHIEALQISASVRVRNVNDHPLPLEQLSFKVRLEDVHLTEYLGQHSAEVSANGFEAMNVEMQATQAGAAMLAELQSGARRSLPYLVEGEVRTADGVTYPFRRDGHIYRVPGKPGQFR